MPQEINPSLQEIFHLIRTDRKQGVALLYQNHYRKLYGIAYSVTKDEAASQDVVHNAVCRLLSLDESALPAINENGWLYTVIKNEALLYLRHTHQTLPLDDIVLPTAEASDINRFVDMDAFRDMIKGLNENRRQIVVLKVLGGYTHKEIAAMLSIPCGTVQWLYNTAIKRLKTLLSSLLTVTVLSLIAFTNFTIDYIVKQGSSADSASPHIPLHILFTLLLFIVTTITFLFTYRFSHLIPTKADRKRIK